MPTAILFAHPPETRLRAKKALAQHGSLRKASAATGIAHTTIAFWKNNGGFDGLGDNTADTEAQVATPDPYVYGPPDVAGTPSSADARARRFPSTTPAIGDVTDSPPDTVPTDGSKPGPASADDPAGRAQADPKSPETTEDPEAAEQSMLPVPEPSWVPTGPQGLRAFYRYVNGILSHATAGNALRAAQVIDPHFSMTMEQHTSLLDGLTKLMLSERIVYPPNGEWLTLADWNEDSHPRDERGRWSDGGGVAVARGMDAKGARMAADAAAQRALESSPAWIAANPVYAARNAVRDAAIARARAGSPPLDRAGRMEQMLRSIWTNPGLTDAQRSALQGFSAPANLYPKEVTSKDLSNALRRGSMRDDVRGQIAPAIAAIDSAIAASTFTEATVVWRGIAEHALPSFGSIGDLIGRTFTDHGFPSTETGSHPLLAALMPVDKATGGPTTGGRDPILRIRIPAGFHGIVNTKSVEGLPGGGAGSREAILPRDTTFRILGQSGTIGGRPVLDVAPVPS